MLLEKAQGIVVPYSEIYSSAHSDFARRMWPNKIRRSDETYIRWKFRGPARGPVEGLLLAVIDDQVVGQLGLLPATLQIGTKVVAAQWACDLMVDPAVREKGIGSMMFAVGMSRNMVTLGSDPSRLADITMSRIGFNPLAGPTKMVLPLNLEQSLGWVVQSNWAWSVPLLASLLNPFWALRNRLYARKTNGAVTLGSLEDAIPRVSANQQRLAIPHICHDREFLTWRYGVAIAANIQTLITQAGGYAICEATPTYFYVYDWHAVDSNDADAILTKVLRLASAANCHTISICANDAQERKDLKRHGFLSMRKPLKVIYYPQGSFAADQTTIHYCLYDSDGNI